jgi:hypothetical protein
MPRRRPNSRASVAAQPYVHRAVKTVFISSIQRDFGDVRQTAAKAIESLGMHPVMAEKVGASAASPRRALLDEVRAVDLFLLLLGPRYGDPGETGVSPTEDEYHEAVRLGKPVIVLKQNVDLEPEQEAFLGRTRGSWERGKLSGAFDGAGDVGLEVVKALRAHEAHQAAAANASLAPDAQERAGELALGNERAGSMGSGSKARFVAVPLVARPLLDALALEDVALPDAIAAAARAVGLASQAMGLKKQVSGMGISFEGKEEGAWETLRFVVGADGAIVAEGAVGAQSGHFSGSLVTAQRLTELVDRSQQFALAVWERIDTGHDVREAAVTLAVPEATHKVYSEVAVAGAISMPMNLPHVLVAPEPARIVRREDFATDASSKLLVAELKRKFADAGAVHRP